jgi:hypothetical protein
VHGKPIMAKMANGRRTWTLGAAGVVEPSSMFMFKTANWQERGCENTDKD